MRHDEADLLLARLARLTALLDAAMVTEPQGGAPTKEVTMPFANVPGEAGNPDTPGSPGVRVQWGRESCHVQVAVLPMVGGFVDDADRARDDRLWSSLDRHGINELIRRLRQARDDAFGADA